MATKLRTKHDVDGKVIDTMACCVKVKVPDSLAGILDRLAPECRAALDYMLAHREDSSSRFYSIPSVISKSLISKYQNNAKCVQVKANAPVILLVGDKGRQIKYREDGVVIPALFKKEVLPVRFPRPIQEGFDIDVNTETGEVKHTHIYRRILSIEFFKRRGEWYASLCYSAVKEPKQKLIAGTIGLDFNAKGNVAVMADPQNGKVMHLGYDPKGTKENFRNRKANLQSKGDNRTLRMLKKKQSRRTKYENHVVSKTVVDYAKKHRRAIIVEDLSGVSKSRKIGRSTKKSQWSYFQLLQYLTYKCALSGVPLLLVDPAYTSQCCSRCGSIHKPNGKHYECGTCGHHDHRDANAAFNLAGRAFPIDCRLIGDGSGGLSAPPLGSIGSPREEAYARA